MLNYTIKNLSKTGFFLGGSNINNFQKNMVPFLFCSRNNFYVIDVIEFLNYTKKILFLFQKLFLNHSNILMIFDSLFFRKKIEDKLLLFFSFLKNYNKSEISFSSLNNYKGIINIYKKQLNFINNYIYNSSFFVNFVNFYSFYINNRNSGLNSFFNKLKDFKINFNYIKFISYTLSSFNSENKKISNNVFFVYFLKLKNFSFILNKNLNFLFKNLDLIYLSVFSVSNFLSNLKDYYILLNMKKKKIIILNKKIYFFLNNYFLKNIYKLYSLKNKLFFFFNITNSNKSLFSEKMIKENIYYSKTFLKTTSFLNSFLKKNLFKKYNFLFFIDNKIKVIKKWLLYLKKGKKITFIKFKLNSLYFFLNILLKFKKDLNIFNRLFNSFYLGGSKVMPFNSTLSFNNYINKLNNKYLSSNLSFWYGKWLNGSLTNYYGLKKNLKKDVEDFKNLKKIPEFIMLFSLKNAEGFLNETSTLAIPLGGISDIKNNPFFFQYYVPANSLDNDFLYFYLLLIFESFLRGFLKEVNTIVS
jgi:hypothetical protein